MTTTARPLTRVPRRRSLAATALSQLREDLYDLDELTALARAGGILPPCAVLWFLEEYAARQREIAELACECQDRADEVDRLRGQIEVLRLRVRELSTGFCSADPKRSRVEAAARSVC